MSSIFQSSIGKKLIMSVTGIFLVLFLLFHMCMNLVAAFSSAGYNAVCAFLGTNWYALAGTAVLALGFVFHIIYAFILTVQNRKARGNDRYAVVDKPANVEWASQNMLALGIVVILGLGLHFAHCWYRMMFSELAGIEGQFGPTDGTAWIGFWFSQWPVVVVYIIWLAALWFHLSHGFWSAMQTFGWNGKVWFNRWKVISQVYSTLLVLGFLVVVVLFYLGCAPSLCCGSCC